MEQYTFQAYETMGWWRITVGMIRVRDDGETSHETLYRGDHVPIDEEDPLIRAVLLLDQVSQDLNAVISGQYTLDQIQQSIH